MLSIQRYSFLLVAYCSFALPVVNAQEALQHKNHAASYPPAKNLTEGIAWPKGQALPIFATPVSTLDTLEVQSLTVDEQLTFSALQGHINKHQPRIFLLDARSDEGRDTWINTSTFPRVTSHEFTKETKYQLVAKYHKEVKGVVLYDATKNPHFRNLASTVGGIQGLLPVTKEVHSQLKQHGITLDVRVDLTDLPLTTAIETYNHLYETYWPQCEKRLLVSARPDTEGGDHHHTRDIASAVGAAVIWLDNRIPEEREVMRRFFRDMKAGEAIVLGWYTSERSGITTASEFGIGTLPADHFMSASVFSGSDHRILVPVVPKTPSLKNKAYIALFISDGDNIQYTQRAMRKVWDANVKHRGKIPLNWTIAPGLVDIAPCIMNYYYTTATPNDCFVTGPSGMGYAMPFNTLEEPGAPVGLYLSDQSRMVGYAQLTETYLQRSGLRVATIWDDATPMQRAVYEAQCRALNGATVQNFKDVPGVAGSIENHRLRFDKLVIPYAGTYEHISSSLHEQLAAWDKTQPLFLSYQVDIWGELKPSKLIELVAAMQEKYSDTVQFVRADHYFQLYNQAHEVPFNLSLCENTKVTASVGTERSNVVCDGSPATEWTFSAPAPHWIQYDFGGAFEISRYVLRFAEAKESGSAIDPTGFRFEVSDDGKVWSGVDTQQEKTQTVYDIELPSRPARYVRLNFALPTSVAEFEVYGSKIGR